MNQAEDASYSLRDLNRLAVSARLRSLSDHVRLRAATPTHDDKPGALAGSVLPALAELVAEVQDAVVAYERSRGADWETIADAAALGPDEAERRWGHLHPDDVAVDDPAGLADQLDRWYVAHAGFAEDTLGAVDDPVSRMLDASTGVAAGPGCLICRKYEHGAVPAWAGTTSPPGGYIVDTANWRVGHGPTRFWPAGTMLLEAKRHFLDYAELTADETAEFGPLVSRVFAAVKGGSGASRVHVFSSMDGAPHFHMWFVPRVSDAVLGKRFIATLAHCTVADAEAAADRIRAALPS